MLIWPQLKRGAKPMAHLIPITMIAFYLAIVRRIVTDY
jgi:hypothetical protein